MRIYNRTNIPEKTAKEAVAIIINKQKEIASQWDNIEYTLQNDEFWLFLNNKRSSNPTRIDMIFNLI